MFFTPIPKVIFSPRAGCGPATEWPTLVGLFNCVLIAILTASGQSISQLFQSNALPSWNDFRLAAQDLMPVITTALFYGVLLFLLLKSETILENLILPFISWLQEFQFRKYVYMENYRSAKMGNNALGLLPTLFLFFLFKLKSAAIIAKFPWAWVVAPLLNVLMKLSWFRHGEFTSARNEGRTPPPPSWMDFACLMTNGIASIMGVAICLTFLIFMFLLIFGPTYLVAYPPLTLIFQWLLPIILPLPAAQLRGFSGLASIVLVTISIWFFLAWFLGKEN